MKWPFAGMAIVVARSIVDQHVRREDTEAIQILLYAAGCEWSAKSHEFLSPSGVPIPFLLAGDRAGNDGDVRFPDPRVATPSKHTQVANTRPPTRHKNAALQQNLVRGITCSNTGIGNGSVQAVFFVF